MIQRKTVPECNGCAKQQQSGTCRVYGYPEYWWKQGRSCPMATHLESKAPEPGKVRVGQQKHKKGV